MAVACWGGGGLPGAYATASCRLAIPSTRASLPSLYVRRTPCRRAVARCPRAAGPWRTAVLGRGQRGVHPRRDTGQRRRECLSRVPQQGAETEIAAPADADNTNRSRLETPDLLWQEALDLRRRQLRHHGRLRPELTSEKHPNLPAPMRAALGRQARGVQQMLAKPACCDNSRLKISLRPELRAAARSSRPGRHAPVQNPASR